MRQGGQFGNLRRFWVPHEREEGKGEDGGREDITGRFSILSIVMYVFLWPGAKRYDVTVTNHDAIAVGPLLF